MRICEIKSINKIKGRHWVQNSKVTYYVSLLNTHTHTHKHTHTSTCARTHAHTHKQSKVKGWNSSLVTSRPIRATQAQRDTFFIFLFSIYMYSLKMIIRLLLFLFFVHNCCWQFWRVTVHWIAKNNFNGNVYNKR